MTGPHGILLVDKAPERTSHDVVARVRWLLGTKKVGHAGTLDPMATGVLVLGIGQGTRLLTYLVGLDKTYTATIRLGRATTTDDREGEALGEDVDASGLEIARIQEAAEALRGDIEQVPSTVSAIKVDGQRAYARARAGEEVTLRARSVTVSRLDLGEVRMQGPFLDVDVAVACSSGTYIRALARDLGAALGVGGHLIALRRPGVGPFSVRDAVHVPARGEGDDVRLPLRGLGETAALVLPTTTVDAAQSRDLGHGRQIALEPGELPGDGAPCAALDEEGRLVAVLAPGDGSAAARPQLVIPPEART